MSTPQEAAGEYGPYWRWTLTANPYYFDGGATFAVYENGAVDYVNERLGISEVYGGSPSGDTVASWTEGPYAQSAEIRSFATYDEVAISMLDGQTDLWLNPSPLSRGLQSQFQEPGIEIIERVPSSQVRFLALNLDRFPMSELSFREALDCLLNREYVSEEILAGQAIPSYSFLPAFKPWQRVGQPVCRGSDEDRLTSTVEMLQTAGWTWERVPSLDRDGVGLGFEGESPGPVQVGSVGPGFDPFLATWDLYVENGLDVLGLDLVVDFGFTPLELEEWISGDAWDMAILAFSTDAYPRQLVDWFSTDGSGNVSGYTDPAYDTLATGFLDSLDLADAVQAATRMQEALFVDLPWIPLYFQSYQEIHTQRITLPVLNAVNGIQSYGGMLSAIRLSEQ